MVRKMNYPVQIVPCPIIREADGLAMSSRNALLSKEQRKNAAHISATLFAAANKTSSFSVKELRTWVTEQINQNEYLNTEYFEIVDSVTLQPVQNWADQGKKVGCVAVHCGKIRLIDNIEFGVIKD
jgi:pantoate--beta-alanine ligase